MALSNKRHILPLLVIAQFACTSLWFAGNAVMQDLIRVFDLPAGSLGHLTSSVQFGFICGTLIFALLTISDRFSPSRVFLVCAILGATFNCAVVLWQQSLGSLLLFRFATGFCLAGIYPVGMKIASDYHEKGLGKALGYLLGALVLGTAFPHLLKGMGGGLPWKSVMIVTSLCSLMGGLLVILFIPDGPFRKRSAEVELRAFYRVFTKPKFRSAAFGYFGHMWELYAVWAFIPVFLSTYRSSGSLLGLSTSQFSFLVIGIGSLSCIAGGYLSQRIGSKRTAFIALLVSGLCCLMAPFLYSAGPVVFASFLLIWGMAVVADSPQFSTLVATHAPARHTGTALTIVNSLGFAITILSIQLLNGLAQSMEVSHLSWFLLPGPVFGLLSLALIGRKDEGDQMRTDSAS